MYEKVRDFITENKNCCYDFTQQQQQYILVKLFDIADKKMLLGTFNNEFVGCYGLRVK